MKKIKRMNLKKKKKHMLKGSFKENNMGNGGQNVRWINIINKYQHHFKIQLGRQN